MLVDYILFWFTISNQSIYFMCLCYSCYHFPRHWAESGLVRYQKIVNWRIECLLSTSPHIGTSTDMLQPLRPLSGFATNIFTDKTQLVSLTVSFEGTQTKPTIAPLSLYARNTLCLSSLSIFFHPIFLTTVPNYHRWSIRNCRSDQIEQHLISNKKISIISLVLALVLVASAWTTFNFPSTSPSYRIQLK